MARSFNGSNQYLQNASVIATLPFTVAGWYYLDADDEGGNTIFSVGDTATNNYHELTCNMFYDTVRTESTGDSASAFASSTISPTVGEWQHAAGVWTSTSSRAAYLNGGNKGTDSTESPVTGLDTSSIGRLYRNSPTFYMGGDLAEIGVWSVALTDAEIATLAAGYSPLFVRPQSLVAYWPLMGNLSPEIDRVGGYDMTLVNAPTKAAHPRVIMPPSQQIFTPPPAGLAARSVNISPSANYIQVVTP